jgi:molybdenum cofactor synthesis domain-containing protein
MKVEIRAVVLTISDSAARGEKEDKTGPALMGELCSAGIAVVGAEVLPKDREVIAEALRRHAAREEVNVIFTAGGTGLSPRDTTPEATKDVIEREVPGLPEVMRIANQESTPLAVLSRAVAGIRADTLIVNLPGSVRGVRESFAAIRKILPHAIGTMTEQVRKCGGRE